jgi:uncharacterized protein YhjY with autotransporter beta-barrel domain
MKTKIRFFASSSRFITTAFIAAAALTGFNLVQASPDPPVFITNGVALFQGNQSNGIVSGVDFQPADVTTLDVNSLSGPIQPANAVSGIYFQNSGAGNVIINAGLSGSNIVINTTGAAGISAGSVGSPPANPPDDPFLGIPIPTNSSVAGGVVNVQSHSDITTEGDNAPGIVATSQTTGYSPAVIQQLESFTGSNITFTVIGVTNADGTLGAIGSSVTGTLVDTNGNPIAGNGGTFVINTNGTFSFDAGTNFDGLTNGQTVQTIVNYTVQGVNGTGITNDSSGTLVTTITMTTNGLVFNSGAYLDAYGPSTYTNSVLPDLASYGQSLAGIASAGGAGNSVTIDNEGAITTHGTNSFGILAESEGGNGGTGSGGSISHSAGAGSAGSSGGTVTVTANGSITTISNYSVGVVAWSQGGTGGQGGAGGFWRYGGPGGIGGNGGNVYVGGNGTITTYGDYASGILAVSAGGDGGAGGTSDKVFTGGGNGGNGGQGGTVTVDGDWNITTTGNYAYGIWAKSVGGNAGTGGSGGWIAGHPGNGGQATDGGTVMVDSGGTIETSGDNSYGIYAESVGGFGGQGGSQAGIFYSEGGSGESAGSGGDVYVTQEASGQIITHGTNSHGIYAESVGGGGGSGGGAGAIVGVGGTGGAGGNGGNVTVTNYGEIQTYGEYSKGIYAQSVGGGGGDGAGSGGLVGIGGSGSGVSYGGKVSVFNFGGILTSNDNSDAIFAQSIGGGGGSGAGSGGLVSIGGSGTGGGSASNVDVVNGSQIFTYGTNSRGIFIESIGGGGGSGAGSGGLVSIGGSGSSSGDGGIVTLTNFGTITTTGALSTAIEVQSIGGGGGSGAGSGGLISLGGGSSSGGNGAAIIVANSGDITTFGDYARGIYLQSIGGGGGDGAGSGGLVSIGGSGSLGGNGGSVTLTNSGSITTFGDNADAIFAQSIGGGGGSGAGSGGVLASIGGGGGGSGSGDSVTIANSGSLYTAGTNSCGIFGQSVGGGGGNGAGSGAVVFSMGGKGGSGNNGGAVSIENSGNITTMSNFSYGISAESVGGGGGSGRGSGAMTFSMGGNGAGGGDGGLVQIINTGELTTYGSNASGIFAESVGGGGGNGAGSGAWTVTLGGDGGDSGNGGVVTVTNAGAITTYGDFSPTIFAQSVGGGGGNANTVGAVIFSLGGNGESGGNGSNVTVTTSQQLEAFGMNSSGIFAQSVGGKGGNGGDVVNISASPNLDFSVGIGGGGGDGGDGGVVTINSDSDIITSGTNSQGIVAQSVGGGGGNGGSAFVLSAAANVIEDFPAVDIAVSVGGSGGKGGDGGAVAVQSSGTIITSNSLSAGIFAQSVGGGGGNGGNSTTVSLTYNCDVTASAAVGGKGGVAGNAGAVGVTNNGGIRTEGDYSSGIFAQSVGGGGGQGGNSTTISGDLSVLKDAKDISPSYSFTMSMGGIGGGGGTGGTVNVNNFNNIVANGAFSYGIQAQSIGGSGGSGGNASTYKIELSNTPESLAPALSLLNFSSTFILAGNGGAGGNAGNVTVNNTSNVWTEGVFGVGILAQSVGGGGGAGGNVLTFDFSNDGLPEDSSPFHDVLTNLTQFTQTLVVSNGMGGAGGNSGNVTVTNSGDIVTHGAFAHGIFAQSVGGGGGFSGISDTLDLSSLLFSPGTQAQGDATQSPGDGVSFAGSVGGNGSGGNVTVVQTGNIVTYGNNAHGIYAQSAGGQQSGGTVSVTVDGNIFAQGTNSDGIRAQSVGAAGGGNISVNILSGTVQGGWGSSAGVRLLDGAENTLTNYGAITTLNGVNGTAVLGTGGNESINNCGVIIGSVDLGTGNNQFNNFSNSWFNAGNTINLGQGNLYQNAGVLCPGGNEQIQTTTLTGNYTQTSNGILGIKLAPVSDQLAVNGTASIDGTLAVSLFNGFVPTKGEQFTVLTATGGVTNQFTTLDDGLKAYYALQLGTLYQPNQVGLIVLQGSFVPFALTPNQRAVAQDLDTFSGYLSTNQLQGDPRETNLIATLDAVPGSQLPADFNLIAPEELGALYDMEFGSVDSIVGSVQSRMNDLRNGFASPSGNMSLFEPGGPVMQLASADRSLPPMTKAAPNDDWSAFAGGYGQFVHVSSTANASGYCLQNSGVILDFDKPLDNGLMGGFTLDYAGGEASLVNGGSADMEGGRAGIYGTWFSTNAYLEAQLGAGGSRYDSKRAALGGFASGDTKGFEIDNMLGGGYDLKHNNFTAGMLAEMHYTYVDIEGFTETGSSAPLQIMENDSHSLWTLLGWRFAYDWHISKETFRPELRLGWHHEFMDTTRTIESQMASGAGTVFQVQSPSVGRDSLSVVTGLSTRCSQHLSVFVYYDGELARDDAASHTVSGGLSWDF